MTENITFFVFPKILPLFLLFKIVCATNGYYQTNDKRFCSTWFDYSKGCGDDTCNGRARMSLTSGMVAWMNSNGYSSNATAAKACEISAPWPLYRTTPLIPVETMCSQICDYCAPSTTTTTTTTTTTVTNRRK